VASTIVALVAALAAAGFLLGNSGASAGGPRLASTAVAGHLQLDYPSSWKPTSAAPSIGGMTFSEPVQLAAATRGAGVTAGEVPSAAGLTLLPAPFRRRLEGSLPPGESVRLGTLQALRFSGLRERGSPVALTIYAVPSSAGVATLVCWSSGSAGGVFLAECGRVAATLGLVGARAYTLAPSDNYARAIARSLAHLSTAVAAPAAQLKAAGSAVAQATAAVQLGASYASAERELIVLDVSPREREAHQAIVSGLAALARGYAAASAAARNGNAASYIQARAAIGAGTSTLAAGLHELGTLGYTVAR
jgi:hypothetical protein